MRSKFLLATVLLAVLCTPCWSQLTTLPTPGKLLGFASSPEPCGWLVIGPNNTDVEPVPSDDMKSVVFEGDAGSYIVVALLIKTLPDGKPIVSPQRKVVVLGGGNPVPPPIPPVPGAKWLLILEEPGDNQRAEYGNLLIQVRKDQALSKLTQILDKDAQAEYVRRVIAALPAGYSFPLAASVSSEGKPVRVTPLLSNGKWKTVAELKELLK